MLKTDNHLIEEQTNILSISMKACRKSICEDISNPSKEDENYKDKSWVLKNTWGGLLKSSQRIQQKLE